MDQFEVTCKDLESNPKTWLVTGAAGFIGSNLCEYLLNLNQKVVGLDNFSTGFKHNISDIEKCVGDKAKNFKFIEGDFTNYEVAKNAAQNADIILHQGALGSVPRSIENPINSNSSNTDGTLNIFWAAKECGVKRVVYASSSSVYGDNEDLPKVEELVGNPLSPYAVTKKTNELYARVFSEQYDMDLIGLRYFNVFGKRQNPKGAYAAVIPRWTMAMVKGDKVQIFGDGKTSRDFTYIQNVLEVNILAGTCQKEIPKGLILNAALNSATSLTELFELLRSRLEKDFTHLKGFGVEYTDFRAGDIRHSNADISKAKELLGYNPKYNIEQGLDLALSWYIKNLL